jgi:hypothetical protein
LPPGIVLEAIKRLRRSLAKPPVGIDDYLATLERQELWFVSKLREFQRAAVEHPATRSGLYGDRKECSSLTDP